MSDITPLLLDAKKEYTQRLQEIVEPQISSTLIDIFEQNDCDYYDFQMALRQIPYWNSTIVNTKTQYLITQYPFFDNLVAAVIVTYVKVLSAIRLGDRPNVKLQLPKTEDFVHELYKQIARIVYYDPETIDSNEDMMNAVGDAIENSIRRLIPYEDILQSYLAAPQPDQVQSTPQGGDSSSESSSDSESDEDNEDINISMPKQYATPQEDTPQQPPALYGEPPAYGTEDMEDDEPDQDQDDNDTEFVAPASYPAPPPQSNVSPPLPPQPHLSPAGGPQQTQPSQGPPGQVGAPPATPAPQQQLFGSAQIRTGF